MAVTVGVQRCERTARLVDRPGRHRFAGYQGFDECLVPVGRFDQTGEDDADRMQRTGCDGAPACSATRAKIGARRHRRRCRRRVPRAPAGWPSPTRRPAATSPSGRRRRSRAVRERDSATLPSPGRPGWSRRTASVPDWRCRSWICSASSRSGSGQDERGHIGLVDDLVGNLEQVDHVAAHDLPMPSSSRPWQVVDQVDRVGQALRVRPVGAEDARGRRRTARPSRRSRPPRTARRRRRA